jgi:hypothetical protein
MTLSLQSGFVLKRSVFNLFELYPGRMGYNDENLN